MFCGKYLCLGSGCCRVNGVGEPARVNIFWMNEIMLNISIF
jgi:hypothetical protein